MVPTKSKRIYVIGALLLPALLIAAPAMGMTPLLGSATDAPDNDNFADAELILPIHFGTGNNIGATMEAGEPAPCGLIGSTVWYEVPSLGVPMAANTFGSGYDTVLAAYTGSSVNSLTLLACNDDTQGLQSRIQFSGAPGSIVYIQVGGFFGFQGNFNLNVCPAASTLC